LYCTGSCRPIAYCLTIDCLQDKLYSDQRKRQAAVAAVEEAPVVDNDGDVSGNYDSDADDNDGDGFDVIDESPNLLFQLSDDYKEVVNKVRSIVKMFRRSPTKNDDTLSSRTSDENLVRNLFYCSTAERAGVV